MTYTRSWLLVSGAVLLGSLEGQGQQLPREASRPKLAPVLQGAAPRLGQAVRVSVTDQAAFRQWLRHNLPQARAAPSAAAAAVLVVQGLPASALARLAACPLVQFVDVADRPAHEERRLGFLDLAANAVTPVHARFPQLTGQGLTVSVKEEQFNAADIDFKGRVLATPQLTNPVTDHATIMATIMAGGGNTGPLGKGAAWRARLVSSSFARLAPDDGAQLAAAGVSVQNHSYGAGIENYYGLDAVEYDQQVRQYPSLLHVFSAGNVGSQASTNNPYAGLAGYANLTGQFKMSKNTLSVGATDALNQVPAASSRGPAYDGRVKPELVAYGDGGSSEAAALVSGISLLVQQAGRDLSGGALPPAALVKAVLLNSADDLGRPQVDFVHGFGSADALGAITTIRDGRFFSSAIAGTAASRVFTITVPAGQQELKATLAWTDPAASPNALRALVNDLDLELVHPATGQRWKPWALSSYPRADSLALPARRRADHLNNAEQVTLALPAAGTYELHVRGYDVPAGPQDFSLAYEYAAPGMEWRRPLENQTQAPGGSGIMRWEYRGAPATWLLQYRPVGTARWRNMPSPSVHSVDLLSKRAHVWPVPDTTTLVQLRLDPFTAGTTPGFLSEVFFIGQPPRMEVGYTCEEETLLQWTRVPGAAEYQVYQLGATHLEPLLRTADTTLLLSRAQMQNRYYAVAPIVQGRLLEPGNTIDFTSQGTACYFRSFRVRQLVEDTIRLDVELGSVAHLRSAVLERQGPNGYEAVQTLAPVPRPVFNFADLPSASGRYVYRVRLETLSGKVIYSQSEEAYRVPAGRVLAFPNPVAPGQTLKLVGSSGAVLNVQVYDAQGRFVRAFRTDGVINDISVAGLTKGLYLLRVSPDGQSARTVRVVVLE